jgi:Outer membrane protein beta-barrel domain
MLFRALVAVWVVLLSYPGLGQDMHAWNFTVGGGVGFPEGTSANYVNNGANFVVGGGPNLWRWLGVDAEYMWHDLPIKQNILKDLQVPGGGARVNAVTFNAIVPIPTHGKMGFYAIGGGGWYHRSGELTEPTYVPGTVCAPFYLWWGGCVDGFFPANKVLASSSSDAWGGNIGGGVTYRFGIGLKLYTEVRYHYAPHKQVGTELLPLTIGVRW